MENTALHASSWAWQFAAIMTMNRPTVWMAQGALLIFLSLTGLYALAPLNYRRPQPQFFVCRLLLMTFWLGLAILLVSLLGWVIR